MQTERITLPAGDDGTEHWAEIRPVSDLRARDKKAVTRAITVDVGDDGVSHVSVGIADDMRDALLVRLITAWSYELPLPVADPASLDELPVAAYDALIEATKEHYRLVDFKKRPGKGGETSSA